ncbi:MAG TPA: thiamine-phosphate kinase, partial [Gemmatimonadota bacterium]|nr:thiamine-phosphate kinase [Gemmatimonadota bacterium]
VIDVSDGLSSDAQHLAGRSRVRVALDVDRIPIHPATLEAARLTGLNAADWALHGGEEFELLFCAPAGSVERLALSFEERFGIPLTRIGTVEAGTGVVRREGANERPLERGGWDHFRVAPPVTHR